MNATFEERSAKLQEEILCKDEFEVEYDPAVNEALLEELDRVLTGAGLSKSTHRNYNAAVRDFLEFTGAPAATITQCDIRNYTFHLLDEAGLAASTVNQRHSAINYFMTHVVDAASQPAPFVKMPQKLPTILTREQAKRLLDTCDHPRYKAIFAFGYGSGLRLNEVCTLRIGDIDSADKLVRVRGGKGGKDRVTILSQTALEASRDYLKSTYRKGHRFAPDDYLFEGMTPQRKIKPGTHITGEAVEAALKRFLKAADIEAPITFHGLRHSFATHMYQSERDLLGLKACLGHSSLRSTQLYVHLAGPIGHVSPADWGRKQ